MGGNSCAFVSLKVKNKTMPTPETNTLFPVFLKLEHNNVLIVGGGNVAFEKLSAVLRASPVAAITLVARSISNDIHALAARHGSVCVREKEYARTDLLGMAIVIVAVDEPATGKRIRDDAHAENILVNIADTPALCDFYLGAIVHKGNLKVAISTNGTSPTIAKRLKELLVEVIPDDIDALLHNMHAIRSALHGNFAAKVQQLNALTASLSPQQIVERQRKKYWYTIASRLVLAFFLMFAGHLLLSHVPLHYLVSAVQDIVHHADPNLHWMILIGFVAQLIDGALGMGYGVTCTIALLSLGVNVPAISGSIHTAEMFSSGISGYSHYRFGNVNKKLLKALLVPGVLGAIVGAVFLSLWGNQYADVVKPLLACYALFLGSKIILSAYTLNHRRRIQRVGWLAGMGGFLDSFGGGGWGPLVTSTLISKGRTPRYIIGSVSLAEFFVTLASAVTFFTYLGVDHWQVILGLVVGGVLAAPLAAKLAGKLPLKTMLFCIGGLVIVWSLKVLLSAVSAL